MTADVKPDDEACVERDGEKMPRLAQEPRGRVGIDRIVEHIRRHVREHGLVAVPRTAELRWPSPSLAHTLGGQFARASLSGDQR